ncbi:hypothetical protein AB0B45_44365 [Nonomuraea sp. NPDC049152]|uniref:hypothetical protein n=1 Tax=Nonomuraea sp. NPDC049152 TaxID=3154350 RepID=UPI0033EB8DE4
MDQATPHPAHAECVTLRGVRPAGPPPASPTGPVTVQRVVSSRGHFQIVGQRIQVGRIHARKILEVTVDDTHITIHDNGELIRIVPRTTTQEITRIAVRRAPCSRPRSGVFSELCTNLLRAAGHDLGTGLARLARLIY